MPGLGQEGWRAELASTLLLCAHMLLSSFHRQPLLAFFLLLKSVLLMVFLLMEETWDNEEFMSILGQLGFL